MTREENLGTNHDFTGGTKGFQEINMFKLCTF